MTTTNPHTATVRAAARRLHEAQAAQARIAEKLAAAEAGAPSAPDLSALLQAHQDAAAGHALGEVDAKSVEAARLALSRAREAAQTVASERATADLVVAGLRRKLDAAAAELAAAAEALKATTLQWLHAERAAAESDYLQAASPLWAAYSRHRQVVDAIAQRGEPLPRVVKVAGWPDLPCIGELTAALYVQTRPHPEHGAGADLADVLPDVESGVIEGELSALLEPPAPGIVATLKRAVGAV